MCEFEERTQSNKVQIHGLNIWSQQPGVQCLVHLTYGYELIHAECISISLYGKKLLLSLWSGDVQYFCKSIDLGLLQPLLVCTCTLQIQ